MSALSFLTLALYVVPAFSTPCSGINIHPTVTIDSGPVAGTITLLPSATVIVNQFLGIPFGAPPVRFSPPKPVKPWNSTYDASVYKPSCIQQFNQPEARRNRTMKWFNNPPPPAGESEDCLNLNIFAPATGGTKAVIFWIYGGGFNYGAGSLPLYDGSSFATNQDVIVVTSNYRTNLFGFPGAPELPKTERNLGWLDQRLALDWVHRNIASFGGDPNRVTLAGESAGSGSIDALITTPPNPLTFHGAIMQSGVAAVRPKINETAYDWDILAQAVNCSSSSSSLQCIRSVPATKLKEILEQYQLNFNNPPPDGSTLTYTPNQDRRNSTDEKSKIARVPILIGSNNDEGRIYTIGVNNTAQYIRGFIPGVPDEVYQTILDGYPIGAPEITNEYERAAAITGEFSFQCPAKVVAEQSAKAGIKSWLYHYNSSFPNTELFKGSGVYHTSEIVSVFGNYPREGATEWQVDVSAAMQKAWADFAKNPEGGPGWEMMPKVGVFGGGARVGVEIEEGREVLETVDVNVVDGRCVLYQGIYDAFSAQ